MAWMAAIGGVVASAFGATAISAGMAAVVGGLVVGAAAGAIYTAFKGGNLFKNMAFGALGGAALGGIGAYMTGGAAMFGETAAIGTSAANAAGTVAEMWGYQSSGGGLLAEGMARRAAALRVAAGAAVPAPPPKCLCYGAATRYGAPGRPPTLDQAGRDSWTNCSRSRT